MRGGRLMAPMRGMRGASARREFISARIYRMMVLLGERWNHETTIMTTIYGIKNCDTMKKAYGWLDDKGVV
jgi:hypothetical protein